MNTTLSFGNADASSTHQPFYADASANISSSHFGKPAGANFAFIVENIDIGEPLTADLAFQLREALWHHHVLVFRNQNVDDIALKRFASYFGDIFAPPRNAPVLGSNKDGVTPEIVLVSNVDEGLLGNDDLVSHSDHHWTPAPSSASLLYALEVPSKGGATTWISLEAAYDALPAALKESVANLRLITYNPFLRKCHPLPDGLPLYRTPDITPLTPFVDHPLIRTHPFTGKKLLYLGAGTEVEVVGQAPETGAALIRELRAHLRDAAFAYRHQWAKGDVVFWDNQATLHAREGFDNRERRVLKRISLSGSRPF